MWLRNDRIIMNVPGATTEVVTLKQAMSEAKTKQPRSTPSGRNRRHGWARCSKSSRLS